YVLAAWLGDSPRSTRPIEHIRACRARCILSDRKKGDASRFPAPSPTTGHVIHSGRPDILFVGRTAVIRLPRSAGANNASVFSFVESIPGASDPEPQHSKTGG